MPGCEATAALPLNALPLTAAAFAPYGALLALDPAAATAAGVPGEAINDGTSRRFELLPALDLQRHGGRAVMALYQSQARPLPLALRQVERHVLSAQVFVPLQGQRFVVVVAAAAGAAPDAAALRAFVTDGRHGVLLAAGTWHHGLLALDAGAFLVLERRADGTDCELHTLPEAVTLAL
jgi:ureidoglycolate lyase